MIIGESVTSLRLTSNNKIRLLEQVAGVSEVPWQESAWYTNCCMVLTTKETKEANIPIN